MRANTHMSERMELSWTKENFVVLSPMKNLTILLSKLSRRDNHLQRDASNFFKAVFGIPSSSDYKNLVNNLNILRNSQNTLINDTRKLAGGLKPYSVGR